MELFVSWERFAAERLSAAATPEFRLERCPRPKQIYDRQTMSLTRSLIPQQQRPIPDILLVRLSLRQGQGCRRPLRSRCDKASNVCPSHARCETSGRCDDNKDPPVRPLASTPTTSAASAGAPS